ncbi:hypothetical protein [Arthrobacter sp. 754]|uniref:hypothetical protein n=1 Tax=Arthrobacter sp. 754 TaxID=3156315 RepID=UPI0033951C96
MTQENLMPSELTVPLVPGVRIRLLRRTDAAGMSLAYGTVITWPHGSPHGMRPSFLRAIS